MVTTSQIGLLVSSLGHTDPQIWQKMIDTAIHNSNFAFEQQSNTISCYITRSDSREINHILTFEMGTYIKVPSLMSKVMLASLARITIFQSPMKCLNSRTKFLDTELSLIVKIKCQVNQLDSNHILEDINEDPWTGSYKLETLLKTSVNLQALNLVTCQYSTKANRHLMGSLVWQPHRQQVQIFDIIWKECEEYIKHHET